ncbi:MAG: putative lipid II flippase FtsW [Actinomycetota bacterium]|nr:putative lipid II flippase FtsW [Actinomycetota bacterium]
MTLVSSGPTSHVVTRPTGAPGLGDRPMTSFHLVLAAGGALLLIGLIMVFSATSVDSLQENGSVYASFGTQVTFAGFGLVAFWIALRMRPTLLRRLAGPGMLIALLLLVLVLIPGIGQEYNEARRWFEIGPLSLQPSELAKVAFVVWGADLLVRKRKLIDRWPHLLVPLVPAGVLLGVLVLMQPNLGTALVFFLILFSLLWSVGAPARLFVTMGTALVAAVVVMIAAEPYRAARLTGFLDPFADPDGATLQAANGLYALATGGWWGVGLGNSRMKWGLLPEQDSDFIFAIIGEELGFAGCLLVLALYGLLAYAGIRVARRTNDGFIRLAAAAITVWLIGQALINVGYVVGLLPITGLPLPLISSGGTSLILTMFAVGILANFARHEPAAVSYLKRRRRTWWARAAAPVPHSAGSERRQPRVRTTPGSRAGAAPRVRGRTSGQPRGTRR